MEAVATWVLVMTAFRADGAPLRQEVREGFLSERQCFRIGYQIALQRWKTNDGTWLNTCTYVVPEALQLRGPT